MNNTNRFVKIDFMNLKVGSKVSFLDKKHDGKIINAEILSINTDNNTVRFLDLDYPDVGVCGFSYYSVSKYWDIYDTAYIQRRRL